MENERREAHEFLDQLPDSQLSAVRGLLESMVSWSGGKRVNEPATDEDVRRVQEAKAWLAERGGAGVSMEEVLADFGLTLDDFPLKK